MKKWRNCGALPKIDTGCMRAEHLPKNGRVLGKVSSGTQGTIVYPFVRLRPSFGAGEKTSEGGKVTMPLSDMFWGASFGVCTDKYGINWMFNYENPQGS